MIEPFLPIGEYGPYPKTLRHQFEGVIWRFRTGAQWREMPDAFAPWPTGLHKLLGIGGSLNEKRAQRPQPQPQPQWTA